MQQQEPSRAEARPKRVNASRPGRFEVDGEPGAAAGHGRSKPRPPTAAAAVLPPAVGITSGPSPLTSLAAKKSSTTAQPGDALISSGSDDGELGLFDPQLADITKRNKRSQDVANRESLLTSSDDDEEGQHKSLVLQEVVVGEEKGRVRIRTRG